MTVAASYLLPTPAGAFQAASLPEDDDMDRQLIRQLLCHRRTPDYSHFLTHTTGRDQAGRLMGLLGKHWIECLPLPELAPEGSLEIMLPGWLKNLTQGGQVLLADTQGFCLGMHGFSHDAAEDLSALSAELANLHQRRSSLLSKHLGLETSAWGICDAAGFSRIGFWPLYAGLERFVLVVAGVPAFNRPALVNLIWALQQHYALPENIVV